MADPRKTDDTQNVDIERADGRSSTDELDTRTDGSVDMTRGTDEAEHGTIDQERESGKPTQAEQNRDRDGVTENHRDKTDNLQRSPTDETGKTDVEKDGAGVDDSDTESTDVDDTESLRRQVEQRYDFDDFGPSDMAQMTPEEWDVAFDPETWITGRELIERVEAELKSRIAERDVFAVLEYAVVDDQRVLVAYSDTDYAIIYPDGRVEGRGTVVRDVKPTVALASMDSYDIEEPPEHWQLPEPEAVPESGSELGNWMLQLLAGTQLLVGIGALVVWPIVGARDNLILLVAGLGFVFIGLLLFTMVANARLSEKFRAEEYRDRLRTIGTASERRPEFLPIEDEAFEKDNSLTNSRGESTDILDESSSILDESNGKR